MLLHGVPLPLMAPTEAEERQPASVAPAMNRHAPGAPREVP